MADVETGIKEEAPPTSDMVVIIDSLDRYEGSSVQEKVDAAIEQHSVLLITKSWCPFSKDVKEFLGYKMEVKTHAIHVNEIPQGAEILKYAQEKTGHKTVPMVFIKGKFVGGCDTIKALHEKDELERDYLYGLIQLKRTKGTDRLETSQLLPPKRGEAMMPLFWFPNTVNNNVVRVTGLQVFIMSALSCGFFQELWGRYLAVGCLIDFSLRLVAGSFVSPLGMIATVLTGFWKPDFRPGPPKQFASFCGLFFSLMGTIFYFVEFEGHEIVGAVFMGGLAGASGMEAFLDFCLGCLFFGYGIQFGLLPAEIYRIYTQSRQEVVESWDYRFLDSNAKAPVRVDMDPHSPISLKYKKKSDEWTKDDFELVCNMQVSYFGMPLSLAGLALAFKIATDWSVPFFGEKREVVVQDAWYFFLATFSAFFFVIFAILYTIKVVMYRKKVQKEWMHPLFSNSFGAITISVMLYAALMYDRWNYDRDPEEESAQQLARIFFWAAFVLHGAMSVIKMGEWVGRSLEMEHVYPHWMMMPVGLAVAALVGPIVGFFAVPENDNNVGNHFIARFFFSFAWLMWITLFVVTFFKTVTTPNSDSRVRHGLWIWVAAPCVLGLADFMICNSEAIFLQNQCVNQFSNYFFMGIFIFLGLCWATLPHYSFFGQDPYGAGYWIECFALDTLAACASIFYASTGFEFAETLQFIFLTIASIANMTAFLHFLLAVIRRRGVFTPEVKWGPLSFMKLTHEAIRGNLPKIQRALDAVSLDDDSKIGKENLDLFAAHFNRFVILHDEHSKHEDKIIFKTFNDFFPEHAKKYNEDHSEGHEIIANLVEKANTLLDQSASLDLRKEALVHLKAEIPPFFEDMLLHLKGEEDNLNPIGRKYIPLAIAKEMSRDVWKITPAARWEVIVPYIINNLPRHMQRVRYIKVLTWSMPERAQQIGAIIYRNVDAVMWERLRSDVPEIIPRGAPNWKRYY